MKTREVFQILRKFIEPPLLELNFQPIKDSTGSGLLLVWTRPRKGKKFETVARIVNRRHDPRHADRPPDAL